LVTPAFAAHLLPERPPDAHKGTFGKALIVAGSVNYTGAAHLAGAAAYRIGAGLVTMGVIPSVHPIVAAGLVEATWLLLPEQLGVLSPEAARSLTEEAGAYAALLVGPGLTQEQEAVQFVHRLLGVGESRRAAVGFVPGKAAEPAANDPSLAPKLDDDGPPSDARPTTGFLARRRASAPAFDPDAVRRLPLVIDADALNALAQVDGWPQHLPPNAVLTPHPGEMARLCGCSTREVAADRFGMARSKAAEWNAVVLLKGAYSVVAAPDGRTAVLPFANPALATAGSGDVLAGAIVGLLAQGLPSFEGAVLGGYLHGLAGELARQDIGDAGVVAGDLLARLPEAIRRLRSA
jgi:NAD(P)H-hydrate epimerase